MPVVRYGLVWLEIAREDYASLHAATRRQIGARVEQLLENPRHTGDYYDELTDHWTTTYGAGPHRRGATRQKAGYKG